MKSITHWVAIIIVIFSVSYSTLYFSKAEAVYSQAVGTLSVSKFVPVAGNGSEFVTLKFSGILGKASTADLSGWTLMSEKGMVYDLSEVVLTELGSVKICEGGSVDESCDYHWEGSDSFNDSVGALKILARDGTPVVYMPYGGDVVVASGASFSGSGDYLDDVYTAGDKISVCEMQKKGELKLQKSNIQKLTRDVESDIAEAGDVVPPFVYKKNKTLNFHPGVNWPAGEGVLEGGCK